MAQTAAAKPASAERPSLTLTRRFRARPEKVWAAWTEPEKLIAWFCTTKAKPGSMRATMTRPMPVPEPDTFCAIAMIARSPVQSPRLETNCAPISGMNPGVRNTRQGAGGIGTSSGADGMNGAWSLTRRPA